MIDLTGAVHLHRWSAGSYQFINWWQNALEGSTIELCIPQEWEAIYL